jgi:hypothetical protein
MQKQAKNLFSHRSEKIRFRFASFCFEAKIMAVFRFCFTSFRFKANMMAVFASFLFCFCFVPFRFASDFYVSYQRETSEKSTFFRIEAKKNLLQFRFILLRSENDSAP